MAQEIIMDASAVDLAAREIISEVCGDYEGYPITPGILVAIRQRITDGLIARAVSGDLPPVPLPEIRVEANGCGISISVVRAAKEQPRPEPKVTAPPKLYVNRKRLKSMLRYFRNKRVNIRYEYNNSMGGHEVREDIVTYDNFEIRSVGGHHHAVMRRGEETVFEQAFDDWGVFVGLGKIQIPNGGPYCYFDISPAPSLAEQVADSVRNIISKELPGWRSL